MDKKAKKKSKAIAAAKCKKQRCKRQTTLGTVMESAALMAAYRLPRPNPKNLGIGHNRIWAAAHKLDNKFSMIKDHIILRGTFSKYRTMISTWEEWDKDWSNRLRKWQVWFTDGPCNQQRIEGLGQEFANIKAKYNGISHWDRML